MEQKAQIDLIDLAFIFFGLFVLVKVNPLMVIILAPLYLIQHYGRRTKEVEALVEKKAKKLKTIIVPPPVTEKIKTRSDEPFWKGLTDQHEVGEVMEPEPDILRHIPRKVDFVQTPYTHGLTVPIGFGISQTGKQQWFYGDFKDAIIHGLVAGQTGSGKDTILKLWFYCLTQQNKPYDVKFVILDGKGEWLLPAIQNSQYVYASAGGLNMVQRTVNGKSIWVDQATEDIEDSIGKVFSEISRRVELFKEQGVANIDRYREKTGLPMARIIVYALDIGTNIKSLETLFNILTAKGRSLGIHIIISMQTTSNQSTFWRSNLGLVLAGNLQLDSQDQPVLGIKPSDMLLRPSKLPSPKQRPGIFVGRMANQQFIVQVPYIDDSSWETFIDTLPQRQPITDLRRLLA